MASNNQTQVRAEAGKQEIFIVREFEARREWVFKAFTDPALIVKWLGPRELKIRLDQFEPRNGGSYRYVHTDPSGNEYGFHGVCHEVLAPERIIQTFEFEGLPEKGHVVLETTKLEALPGNRTRITIHSVFQSVADRDGMVMAGMERGMRESHERLDELFEKNQVSS
jgi:uncharacterized protein YndB with AHSA1/START domain